MQSKICLTDLDLLIVAPVWTFAKMMYRWSHALGHCISTYDERSMNERYYTTHKNQ